MARSTGCACPTSIRRACAPASSMPRTAAPSSFNRRYRSTRHDATCPTPTSSKRTSRPASGSVRVVDALTLPNDHLDPMRELVRSVEGVSGAVPMRWRFVPRFNYGHRSAAVRMAAGHSGRHLGLGCGRDRELGCGHAVVARPRGRSELRNPRRRPGVPRADGGVRGAAGHSRARGGHRQARGDDPVLGTVVARARVPRAMGRRRRAERARAEAADLRAVRRVGGGPDDVAAGSDRRRAQLGLSLLLDPRLEFHHQRAVAARMSPGSAIAVLVVHAGDRLDRAGAPRAVSARRRRRARRSGRFRSTAIGARGRFASGTARSGSGSTISTAGCSKPRGSTASGTTSIDGDTGEVLGRIADRVCDIWRQPDSGIWEVRNGPFHFTHSKVMCWVALDRAARLGERGELPSRGVDRWRREAAAIRAFVERSAGRPSCGATRASPAAGTWTRAC